MVTGVLPVEPAVGVVVVPVVTAAGEAPAFVGEPPAPTSSPAVAADATVAHNSEMATTPASDRSRPRREEVAAARGVIDSPARYAGVATAGVAGVGVADELGAWEVAPAGRSGS